MHGAISNDLSIVTGDEDVGRAEDMAGAFKAGAFFLGQDGGAK